MAICATLDWVWVAIMHVCSYYKSYSENVRSHVSWRVKWNIYYKSVKIKLWGEVLKGKSENNDIC